jgi:uncharacterized membrane protein YhaH (DUF805 family)
MNYLSALIGTIRRSFDYKGRSSSEEFWRASTAWTLLNLTGIYFFSSLGEDSLITTGQVHFISMAFQMVISLPLLALGVRRLHDIGKSGWWNAIGITLIGLIPLFYWDMKKSSTTENRYGAVPPDADSGNFHRNVGATLYAAIFLLIFTNAYSAFFSFKEWQEEEIEDSGQKSKIIYRLFSAKETRGGIIKMGFICTGEKDMAVFISTLLAKNNLEMAVPIVDPANAISIAQAAEGGKNLAHKTYSFEIIEGNKNAAISAASKDDLLKLIKNDISVSVNIGSEIWRSEVNSTDPKVQRFVNDCAK